MFSLLTLDAARDAVARQFEYGEPDEAVAPTRTPGRPTRTAAPAHRSRSNPFAALLHRTGDVFVRATWSPTR